MKTLILTGFLLFSIVGFSYQGDCMYQQNHFDMNQYHQDSMRMQDMNNQYYRDQYYYQYWDR